MGDLTTLACKARVLLVFLLFQGLAALTQAQQTFTDNFNRPDGPAGNGWSDSPGNAGGNLVLRSGALTTPLNVGGSAAIFRPIELSGPITVAATITQENGFNGLLRRYSTHFVLGSNGSLNRGYELVFSRGDQNFADSAVSVVYNGVLINSLRSTFQFGAALAVNFSVNPDRSISGTVSGDGLTFPFFFGTQPVVFDSANLAIRLDFPDTRASLFTYPTVDDLSVTTAGSLACPNAPANISVDNSKSAGLYVGTISNVVVSPGQPTTATLTVQGTTLEVFGHLFSTSTDFTPSNFVAVSNFIGSAVPATFRVSMCDSNDATISVLLDKLGVDLTVLAFMTGFVPGAGALGLATDIMTNVPLYADMINQLLALRLGVAVRDLSLLADGLLLTTLDVKVLLHLPPELVYAINNDSTLETILFKAGVLALFKDWVTAIPKLTTVVNNLLTYNQMTGGTPPTIRVFGSR